MAATPIVAAKDSTLAATRMSGAASERSSSVSTMKITARMAGMITLRSRSLASRTSRLVAVLPADEHLGADRVEVGPQGLDRRLGRHAVGGVHGRGLEHHLPVDDLRRLARARPICGSRTPGSSLEHGEDLLGLGLRREHLDR